MEKRNVARQLVEVAATIEFGGGGTACMVRNISDGGALLELTNAVHIPENVSLVIPTEGKHLSCRVVWRKEKRIGVMFE